MRRQSSYERYSDFGRSGDRYYDQSRGTSHTSGYGYDRSDSRSYYDSYHYSNYSNTGSQYDYGRYQYAQPQSFSNYYDQQPATSRSRVDYGDYYGAMYKRYYESYDSRNPSANAYGYYRESATTDFRHPQSSSVQRSESGSMITPSFDRYQSSKARLYSFGYRKSTRNLLTSPKKFSKLDSKSATNKLASASLQQEVIEEKVEEISPNIDSLAKLTLSMINYRIALHLLSLNLTINPEPNESSLFLRNQPDAIKSNDVTGALSKEPSSISPSAPSTGEQVNNINNAASSFPPTLIPPTAATDNYQDGKEFHHYHGNVPPSASKRPASAVDSSKSDFPSSKRLRAQSSEEEGMIREKSATDDYRDHHREGYSHHTGSQTYSSEDYGRNHSTSPPAMHRNYSYESASGGRHSTYNSYNNSSHYYDTNAANGSYASQTSPREYSASKKDSHGSSASYTPSSKHHHSHQPPQSSNSGGYHSAGKGGDYGIGYPAEGGGAYASRTSSTSRYYDHHYDDRGRDYPSGYPTGSNYSSSYYRENSVGGAQLPSSGYAEGRDRDGQGDNKGAGHTSSSSSSYNMHRQSSNQSVASTFGASGPTQAPSSIPSSAASVAGTVSSAKMNDMEEGEYRERVSRQHSTSRSNYSHTSQQQAGAPYQNYNYNSSNNGSYYSNHPSSTSYPGESSYPTNANARGSTSSREYYNEYDQRRYASQSAYPPQSSGREYSGGSASRDYRDYGNYRSGHSSSGAPNASSTPYQHQHHHSGQSGSAPSSGTRGGNGTMSSLRTPR